MATPHDGEDSSDERTPGLVEFHFDYYNIDASNDYHALHRLLIQLLGRDAERIETGPLTELVATVAEASGVGSTVKTDEEAGSDPYAVLTVISCRDHAGMRGLTDYVLSKTEADPVFHGTLSSRLQHGHVGLVVSERVVNMPVEVMSPMYRLLSAEIAGAMQAGLPGYGFTDYLFLSRVYRQDGVRAFHAEDAQILQHATHAATFAFADDGADGAGLDVAVRAMLVPGERFGSLVTQIAATYAVPA